MGLGQATLGLKAGPPFARVRGDRTSESSPLLSPKSQELKGGAGPTKFALAPLPGLRGQRWRWLTPAREREQGTRVLQASWLKENPFPGAGPL